MRTRSLAVVLLLSATVLVGGKKKRLAVIDELVASHPTTPHDLPAAGDIQPMQWAPGQWSLYRRTDKKGRVSLERLSIVARDACGFQVESVQWMSSGTSGTRICYAEMPVAFTAHDAVDEAMDLVRVFTTWSDDGTPMTIDLRTPEGAMMRGMMRVIGHGMMTTMRIDVEQTRTTIEVPAGRFAGAISVSGRIVLGPIKMDVQGWAHPGVPINGSVKVEASDGSVNELLDFGLSGAVSAMPGAAD